MNVALTISPTGEAVPLSIAAADAPIASALDPPIVPVYPDAFDGPYEVAPASEAQVLATGGHTMRGDLIIDPIPSNYGLITWDGTVLTVS